MADNLPNINSQDQDASDVSNEKKSSNSDDKENPADQIKDLNNQVQGLNEAINAGIATWGWSEIGRILLKITCRIVPPLEGIGKLNPKLKFYFTGINLKKIIDLAELLEFTLLVIVWGLIILAFVTIISLIAYCLSGVSEGVECGSALVGIL